MPLKEKVITYFVPAEAEFTSSFKNLELIYHVWEVASREFVEEETLQSLTFLSISFFY